MYICEQLLGRTKHRKNEISSEISGQHLKSLLKVAATCIKPEQCVTFTHKKAKYPTSLMFLLLTLGCIALYS